MAVPTIALYASPPGSVCSTPYPCSSSSDYEVNPRPPAAAAAQKPTVGGLSRLFASASSVRHPAPSSSFAGDEIGTLRHDRGGGGGGGGGCCDDFGSSYCYSPSPFKCRDQSPVSVFHGPVSCGSVGSVRSPPQAPRISRNGDLYLPAAAAFRSGRDRLFNGFVGNALGSCVDYDSPSFPMPVTGTGMGGVGFAGEFSSEDALGDELAFNVEENLEEMDCEPFAKSLLLGAQSKHSIFYDESVVKAFYEAEKAHRGQMRASGDPYLQHCVETAVLLAMIGADATVVTAGLLHDTLDDTFMNYGYIFQMFGAGVADLVEGVSKLSHLSKLARENNTASKTDEADRLHTMFLAMADARAVLIKLADRLHNMMTLEALPFTKRERFARETMEIFAPLANRLGISSWKEQLENLCFKHLNPEQHEELSSQLIKSFDEAMITTATAKLEKALKAGAVSYRVLSGRHKSLYSIYTKMSKKKLTMDEIHDIHGLRLIVENEQDCYAALDIVHHLWPEVPGRLKDYIKHPKSNGYRSLHTVVRGEDMLPFEVQIRTKEMHMQAEFGFAAHWRYKEDGREYSNFVSQMVKWAQWALSWQCEAMNKERALSLGDDSFRPPCPFPSHLDDCPHSYTPQCSHSGPVFVIMIENEKMSVQEFPANSTVMDLLGRVGRGSSRLSPYPPVKEELRPRLNHEPVFDPTQKLKMGDVLELTPTIPDKSLTEYREEIQRMYDWGLTVSSRSGLRS